MEKVKLPRHLRRATKNWAKKILSDYDLEPHHQKILIAACEVLDRISEARERVKREGAYYVDFRGAPRSHPGLADERNNRVVFSRLIRELNLSEGPPEEPRPPGLKY